MRNLLFLLLISFSLPTWAATKWCSQSGAGDLSGSSAANACAFTTANVLTAFGGSLTRGDTLYVCGTLSGSATWAPGGVGGASGYFTVSGNATDSGCTAGGWDMSNAGGVPVAISGGGRSFIKLTDLFFRNCASICMTLGGTDNVVTNSTFSVSDDSTIRSNAAASRITVSNSTFSNWGDDSSTAEAAINVEPADSVAVDTYTITGNTFIGNGVGRYGVSGYPAGTLHNGTVTGLTITNNTFKGAYYYHPVNISRDVDNSVVSGNDFLGVSSAGGAVIHVGGQGTYGTCSFQTTNTLILNNTNVNNAVVNVGNPADAAGIFADECSTLTYIYSNYGYNNAVAGIYLNDADTVTAVGNVFWANGDNALHIHGVGSSGLFYNNTFFCGTRTAGASGVADQGLDCVQVDSTIGAGYTFKNNIVYGIGSVPKCFDADGSITDSYNLISGCATRTEGFTPTSSLSALPLWETATPTSLSGFRLRAGSTARRAGTDVGLFNDVRGRPFFRVTPSMGGVETTSGSEAAERTTRN